MFWAIFYLFIFYSTHHLVYIPFEQWHNCHIKWLSVKILNKNIFIIYNGRKNKYLENSLSIKKAALLSLLILLDLYMQLAHFIKIKPSSGKKHTQQHAFTGRTEKKFVYWIDIWKINLSF